MQCSTVNTVHKSQLMRSHKLVFIHTIPPYNLNHTVLLSNHTDRHKKNKQLCFKLCFVKHHAVHLYSWWEGGLASRQAQMCF